MTGGAALRQAAGRGDLETLRAALRDGADPSDADDPMGRTALIEGAAAGHDAIVRELLAATGVDPAHRTLDGETAFSIAAAKGHASVVALLGADERSPLNGWNLRGWTPLITAAFEGHDDIVSTLLGLDDIAPNLADAQGRTALWWAVEAGNGAVAGRLARDPRVNVHAVPDDAPSLPELAERRGLAELADQLRRIGLDRHGVASIPSGDRYLPEEAPETPPPKKIRENVRHFRRGRR